jgi:hypothetical protein
MRILFNDEHQFNWDGMSISRNSHLWSADFPQSTVKTACQQRFAVNMRFGLSEDQLILNLIGERVATLNKGRASGDKALDLFERAVKPLHSGRQVSADLKTKVQIRK